MKIRSLIYALLFILPVSMFAGLTGTYKMSGINIRSHTKYKGKAVITRSGNVYSATWDFGGGDIEVGTGVRKGNCISFVFSEVVPPITQQAPNPGVILYEIKDNTLKGSWVILNSTSRGLETLKKMSSKTGNFLKIPERP